MKKAFIISRTVVVLAASLAAAFGAHAQSNAPRKAYDPSMQGLQKSYIGLSAGMSDYSLGNGVGVFGSDQGDTAYRINGGAYFSRYFGADLAYTDFGKVKRAGGTTKAEALSLSMVGKFPLSPSFNLLGKVGTSFSRTSVSSAASSGIAAGDASGWGLSYGVGGELVLTPQWSMLLEYDSHNLKFAEDQFNRVGATTLGVRYTY